MASRRLGLGVALALGTFASTAFAVLPAETHDAEIPVPTSMVSPSYRQLDADEAARVLPGWASFAAGDGSGWMVLRYRDDLGTPAALAGPGIELIAPIANDSELSEAARRYAEERAELLGLDRDGIGPAEVIRLIGEKRQVHFLQAYEGLEVVGGRADLFFDGGKLVLMGSNVYPEVRVGTVAALSAAEARVRAVEGLTFEADRDQFLEEPRLVVYPLLLGGAPSYFLAWEVKFTTTDPVGFWWTYVDASDGRLLSRTNHVAHYDIPTTVVSEVNENYSYDPSTPVLSPDHWVQVEGETYYTDEDGFVNLPVPEETTYSVTSQIRGRYGNANRQDGVPDASFAGDGTPGVPLEIRWDDSNSHRAERDGYYSMNRIHRWLGQLDPGFDDMDYSMACNVNKLDGVCNAYWNGSSINFYNEGGGCVNMATISDVVMHEYTHGITQFTYSPQPPPTASGMGEAFSDMFAQTITNDHLIGRGIFNGAGSIRSGENLRQYPGTECGGQVHCLGEILMGSMWKARKNLIERWGYGAAVAYYDQIMRAAHKTKTETMPDYLIQLLLADDNNANLADATPNFEEICEAFGRHNLPCPEVTQFIYFDHTPLNDQTSTLTELEVYSTITAVNCGTLLPDSLLLVYSLDQGQTWADIVMEPSGGLDEYYGIIPGQECGTVVSYYLRAVSDAGTSGTWPYRAPEQGFASLMIGPRTPITNDNLESDLGWTVGAPGDAATEGIWERVDPEAKVNNQGVVYQPEDDHTATGVNCFVTDGRGGYYLNYDVDGGATTVLSPIYDFSSAPAGACRFSFWAFFMNDGVVDDTLRASVSNDGGNTWFDVKKIFGRHKNEWREYREYFTSDQVPFTNQMRFRFQLADYNESQTEGAVDDIIIRYVTCEMTPDAVEETSAIPPRFVVEPGRPNPSREGTTIRYGLPAGEKVTVDLFDAAGRLVRTLERGPKTAGYHTLSWDGRDAEGRAVASGVYWYQVRAGSEEKTQKVLILR